MVGSADVNLIETAAGLEELRSEWQTLMDCAADVTPFQSPEWLMTWWRFFGSGELCVVACRSSSELIGLAPLFLVDRTVLFVGTGISDHLEVLYAPGEAQTVASAVREH